MSLPVQKYSADSKAQNFRAVLREMLHGLRSSRYIGYRLARRDIKDIYAKAPLGILWDLLDPLVLSAIFYFLMKTRVINAGDLGMPASVFVVYGMMLFQTFCESLTMSSEIMNRAKSLLGQLKIPPEALILSVLYRVCFNSLFRIVVMLGFSLFSGVFSLLGIVQFLVLFPTIILAGMCIGVFLAPFNAIYNDTGRIIRIVLVPLRYLSPVLYAIPASTMLGKLQIINPLSMIMGNLRLLAVNNAYENLGPTGIHLAVLAVIGLVGWFIFHLSIPILAERV